jgi:hypothetical protein
MKTGRETNSRAKEFDLIFGLLDSPDKLVYQISSSPTGGTLELEGINFEYGNIQRLLKHLNASAPSSPFDIKAKYVCHLDGLQANRKRLIEREHGLESGSISSIDTKADVFILDREGNRYFVSVKDIDKPSKLGQKSGTVSYGKAHLRGGLEGVLIDEQRIPKLITFKDTDLSQNQFEKLTRSNQIYSFFKKNYPKEWKVTVANSESLALEEIRKFTSVLKTDKDSLIDFLSETLGGNLKDDPNFYIVFGHKAINLATVVNTLRETELNVTLEEYSPRGKSSIIVRITIMDRTYCLTKIEPSFEGKNSSVSQTKGIIYHFQQFQDTDNNWKKLIFDVLK